jgi:S-adenosylmethionine hydrolase
MPDVITLITDFGMADEYIGVMKGVIVSIAPAVRIIDLSHNINRHAVQEAALVLGAAYHYFPMGTVHVAVVDPGVGSDRKIILLRAGGHLFIAPDNGLLTFMLADNTFEAAYEVANSDLFLKPTSNTFHGRDIMAPVAARLAVGLDVQAVGPAVDKAALFRLTLPPVTINRQLGTVTGAVIGVDRFGNLLTNIHVDDLGAVTGPAGPDQLIVTVREIVCGRLHNFYGAVAAGSPVALIGSRNYLEIGVNRGNAAKMLAAAPGDAVIVARVTGGAAG